jgi:hypothetical protein
MQLTSGRLDSVVRGRAHASRVVVHRTSPFTALPRVPGIHCKAQTAGTSGRKLTPWDAPEVLVVGAGIAGLAAALALTKVSISGSMLLTPAAGPQLSCF